MDSKTDRRSEGAKRQDASRSLSSFDQFKRLFVTTWS